MKILTARQQKIQNLDSRARGLGRSNQKGFTLIELTLYLAMTMVLSAALLMMLQSHFTFMRVLTSMEFLRDDAPQTNVMLTGILGKADSYRIYGSTADAMGKVNAVNVDGTAVRLRFRNPDGSFAEGIVAFETVGSELQLNYYNFASGAWPASADWTITHRPTAVTFTDTDNSGDYNGVLLVTMTGPYGEQVTYAGTGE